MSIRLHQVISNSIPFSKTLTTEATTLIKTSRHISHLEFFYFIVDQLFAHFTVSHLFPLLRKYGTITSALVTSNAVSCGNVSFSGDPLRLLLSLFVASSVSLSEVVFSSEIHVVKKCYEVPLVVFK